MLLRHTNHMPINYLVRETDRQTETERDRHTETDRQRDSNTNRERHTEGKKT